jgi:acyl-CoA dehydrogenase
MDFAYSPRTEELLGAMREFLEDHVYPAESRYAREMEQAGDPTAHPPVLEELKAEARRRGLWNLFLPKGLHGGELTTLEYAPLAELTGRSPALAPVATNCAAPDTGNMELLAAFGTPEQKERWLDPLLAGEIRSCFAMTEPAVASSDATNIQARVERRGDVLVLNGRKWFTSGAASPRCKVAIFMGVSDPDAPPHRRHSMVLVPMDAPGVTVVRRLPVLGFDEGHGGHPEVLFENVEVPVDNLLGEWGAGFELAQSRLGPGRIHHCMRLIGMAERALELMCRRSLERVAFGGPLADKGVVQDRVAEARIRIETARLLVLKTAWLIDTVGQRGARVEISAIKALVPPTAAWVIDQAMQVHGGMGLTNDTPLAAMYAAARSLRIADGPDEVHRMVIARRELRSQAERLEADRTRAAGAGSS